ncbi:uncharacterized protein LAJ45_01522 [Morchella importuna]|uniref:uncharacterized protein n=1 Tax=Morchella importuna TaxID=1174673 RepID=UPI001E8D8B4E|nr:uncharacterized protein LAJ45_01522 [Morchella importuna]KAH8154989.1 hypothetical protein LAJ45_01522 [Morchella importuna]
MKMHMIPNRRDPPPYSSTDPLQATNGITNDRYTYLNKYNFSEIPTVIVNLIRSYIKLKTKKRRIPPSAEELERIARGYVVTTATRAATLAKKSSRQESLSGPKQVKDLMTLGLYQTVIYLDDSGSMNNGSRIHDMKKVVKRIVNIATKIDPEGISIRFMNARDDSRHDHICRTSESREIMRKVTFGGLTPLGEMLRKKILNPMVYDAVRSNNMTRPLLVSVITDGKPYKERVDTFKEEILECRRFLLRKGFPENAVLFQISQIGDSEDAAKFIKGLDRERDLRSILYCTSQTLDVQLSYYRRRKRDMEKWLLKTLIYPMNAYGDRRNAN